MLICYGEEERSNESGSFSTASIPKRIAVVLAGGLVNIIFGLLVYFALVSFNGNYISTTIDSVVSNYGAEQAGIEVGDKILKINNKTVRLKSDIDEAMQNTNGNETTITVSRNNNIQEIKLIPTIEETKNIGIYLGAGDEDLTSEIKSIYPNSPAQEEGLQQGDIITKVNGTDCKNEPYKVVELISASKNEKIQIEVERNSEIKNFEILPQIQKSYKMGVTFAVAQNNFINNIYYGFWDTLDFSVSIIDNLKMLFSGQVTTDQLMGPVGISEVVSKTQGIIEFVYMLALISLSLGVTNLLPFPPLDGGKIVILLIEWIRRKPLKENVEIGIQMAGFCMLIGLSIYVTYNDILRIF